VLATPEVVGVRHFTLVANEGPHLFEDFFLLLLEKRLVSVNS